jgi:phosphinothricin acetyltransferase
MYSHLEGIMDDLDRASSGTGVTIRDAVAGDMAAVRRIYAHYVLRAVATFDETVPTLADMESRRGEVARLGLPYLVAERGGKPVGFGYATQYRRRSAYRYTVEDSVYVADGLARQGIGGQLLAAMIARCNAGPWRQMIAVIGDSANTASIALHARLGFATVGTLRAVGFKHGRWIDTVLMQRALGPTTGPAAESQ